MNDIQKTTVGETAPAAEFADELADEILDRPEEDLTACLTKRCGGSWSSPR